MAFDVLTCKEDCIWFFSPNNFCFHIFVFQENLQTEFKTKLQTKDEEIQSLKQSLGKEQKRDVPTSPSAEEKLKTLQKSNIQLKVRIIILEIVTSSYMTQATKQ